MSGASTTRPSAEPTTSKARLTRREERESPKRRTPSIVRPSRSSNSTDEPTTSSIRGSTLTRTPSALARWIASSTRWCDPASPATITRCTSCSATTRGRSSSVPSRPDSTDSGFASCASRPTSDAFTLGLALSLASSRAATAASPTNRQRSEGVIPRAIARAATRHASIRTDRPSQVTAKSRAPIGVASTALSSRNATTVVSVAAWNSAGPSSSVLLRSSNSSRLYSPDAVLMRTMSGSRASPVIPGPSAPNTLMSSPTTRRPENTSAPTSARRNTRSRRRTAVGARLSRRSIGSAVARRPPAPTKPASARDRLAVDAGSEHARHGLPLLARCTAGAHPGTDPSRTGPPPFGACSRAEVPFRRLRRFHPQIPGLTAKLQRPTADQAR